MPIDTFEDLPDDQTGLIITIRTPSATVDKIREALASLLASFVKEHQCGKVTVSHPDELLDGNDSGLFDDLEEDVPDPEDEDPVGRLVVTQEELDARPVRAPNFIQSPFDDKNSPYARRNFS